MNDDTQIRADSYDFAHQNFEKCVEASKHTEFSEEFRSSLMDQAKIYQLRMEWEVRQIEK